MLQVLSQDSSSELMAYRLRDLYSLAARAGAASDDESYDFSSVRSSPFPSRAVGETGMRVQGLQITLPEHSM